MLSTKRRAVRQLDEIQNLLTPTYAQSYLHSIGIVYQSSKYD